MACICRHCGSELLSLEAQRRGCCDVPPVQSVEEQLAFWMSHDPEETCVDCLTVDCERRISHA